MVAEKRGRGEVIQKYANRRGQRMRGIQVNKGRGVGGDGRQEGKQKGSKKGEEGGRREVKREVQVIRQIPLHHGLPRS